ncbi:MAG: YraN family protein [Phycisphaerae bacterium]
MSRRRDIARHLELGERGEREALAFLRGLRYRLLAQRFNTRAGELDLVMQDGQAIVFVEVKTRSSAALAAPHEAVNREKRRRLLSAARWYLRSQHCEDAPCRFDVVDVLWSAEAPRPKIEHFIDAFGPDDRRGW